MIGTGRDRQQRGRLAVQDVVEPEYPAELGDRWGGGWSARRGSLLPGTAIFVTRKVGG